MRYVFKRPTGSIIAAIIKAVPSTWESINGFLEAPTHLTQTLINLDPADGHYTVAMRDTWLTLSERTSGPTNSSLKGHGFSALLDIEHWVKMCDNNYWMPQFINFERVGQESPEIFVAAQHIASTCFNRDYQGSLAIFRNDKEIENLGRSAHIAIRRNQVHIAFDELFGGSIEHIEPILAVCHTANLERHVAH